MNIASKDILPPLAHHHLLTFGVLKWPQMESLFSLFYPILVRVSKVDEQSKLDLKKVKFWEVTSTVLRYLHLHYSSTRLIKNRRLVNGPNLCRFMNAYVGPDSWWIKGIPSAFSQPCIWSIYFKFGKADREKWCGIFDELSS
jgi:hypothetical protein